MILIIEAEIFSVTHLKETISFTQYPFTITLCPSVNHTLNKVSIQSRVNDFKHYIPVLEDGENDSITVQFPKEDFITEQIKILQHIESFGALDLGISEINWSNPIIKWIPENEEEQLLVPLTTYRRTIQYEPIKMQVTAGWLQQTLLHRNQVSNLVLPLSFFRKGMNLYYRLEYSEAYVNFFFMLEGLFADGKTETKKVITLFTSSDIMVYAINETLKSLNEESNINHKQWLEKYLKNKAKDISIQSICFMLTDKRGSLSHFSIKNSVRQRNNFQEKESHSPAFIIMMICRFASIKLRLRSFTK